MLHATEHLYEQIQCRLHFATQREFIKIAAIVMGIDFTVHMLTEFEEAPDSAYFVQHTTVLVGNSTTIMSQDGTT